MAKSSDDRNPVERLAEEFLERHRRGEHPGLTEYVDRHPDWAEEIRELFPALLMMERLKPAAGDVTGSFIGDTHSRPNHVPERLGDFRILREVGRGGMGIVFEAEQESLGRHVALKVLPSHALLNPRHLQRFLREARSAARLHHTNIVPVFGVGEADGLHYYAMQFIAGAGLHEVIDELRRLRKAGKPPAEVVASSSPTRAQSIHEIAEGLVTGQFAATPASSDTDCGGANGPLAAIRSGTPLTGVRAASAILSGSARIFIKEVARVGLQVAQALEYAHGQGVLHRDIKPSNLLLDVQGTVWVADFGLAKALADSDNLTHEGDVLGTLRYMAPERFRGQSDARSDIYALGLTLYEFLTLRPAFNQDDRDRLIQQVTTEVPPRPRAINREIPRDLETIVLKAIEHEPARRYQDAEDLAADLERFLADRPIRARPVGALERAAKWARRKPAVAGLLGAFAGALVVGVAGIAWQWREAVAARNVAILNEQRARTNFAHALDTVNTFCTEVSEEQLLDEPGMQPLRRRLLELARQYYQRFQREQGDDRALVKELALSFMRSGIVASELGDSAEAHRRILRAQDGLEELCRADPKDTALQLELARCRIELQDAEGQSLGAVVGTMLGKKQEQSIAVLEQLVAAEPENPDYVRLLGRGYRMQGMRAYVRGEYSTASDSLKKSVAALERLCQVAPDDAEGARRLALAYSELAQVYQETGRLAECIEALERGMAIFAALERRFPTSRRYRGDRWKCSVRIGDVRIRLGRYHDAASGLREAAVRLAELAGENPDAVDVRYSLAMAKRALGEVALGRGQSEAGRLLSDAARILERIPAKSLSERDLLALAWCYVRLGEAESASGHSEAAPRVKEKLVGALKTYDDQLLVGTTVPYQTRERAQLEAAAAALLASTPSATAAERIAAQRNVIQARSYRSGTRLDNPMHQFEVESSRVQLADLLTTAGQLDEARSYVDQALPVLKGLTQAEPENLRWRQGLARAWETLGRVQLRSGRRAEAPESIKQAVAIAQELARLDSAYRYDLACVLGLRASVESSERDAKEAIAALRQAIDSGFDNEYQLGTDPRLDSLRSRPDFPVLSPSPGRVSARTAPTAGRANKWLTPVHISLPSPRREKHAAGMPFGANFS
jgi:serine/threonine-protein kinase